jgi:hypothetical protein
MVAAFCSSAIAAPGDEILGTWEGKITDDRVKRTNIRLEFRRAASGQIEGSAQYPDRRCTSVLSLEQIRTRGGILEFREQTDPVSQDCPTGALVLVHLTSFGQLGFQWLTSADSSPRTSMFMILARIGTSPNQPIVVQHWEAAQTIVQQTVVAPACPRQSRLDEWLALRKPRVPEVASEPWEKARAAVLAARDQSTALLKPAAPAVPDDLLSVDFYERLDRTSPIAAPLTHLALRVPSLWDVNEVLLIAAALSEALRLPRQQFEAVFNEFELAVAEVGDSARDLGFVTALQGRALDWIALQERALSGSDPLAEQNYRRILAAAAASPGMRRLLEASRAHLALWVAIEEQRRHLVQAEAGGRRARFAETLCDVLVSFDGKLALGSIERPFSRLPSATMPEVRAEDRERVKQEAQASVEYDNSLNEGTFKLGETRTTPPRVLTLLKLANMRDLDHLGPEILQDLRRVPPEHPLRARMKELRRQVAAAQQDLAASPQAMATWQALRTRDTRAALGTLALSAAAGDRQALADLRGRAEKTLAMRGLQGVIRVSQAWEVLSREVDRVWPVNWNSAIDELVLYTTLPERRANAVDSVDSALVNAWTKASDRESRVLAQEREERNERLEREQARERRQRQLEECFRLDGMCDQIDDRGNCIRRIYVQCDEE